MTPTLSATTHPPNMTWLNETLNDTWANQSYAEANCTGCMNELCLDDGDYQLYRSWVSVDSFEMVLIAMNIVVFLTGVIGNSLVRNKNRGLLEIQRGSSVKLGFVFPLKQELLLREINCPKN